ncbi:MAG: epimerase [Candidatus Harrisonbacteria bacterium CG10_big_fil_rev_8_21_14_0_10_42_17]|uniref:Epimerase n=1 Tax=Candidatus Harrisonbacteria bacterium CG10_big_fil_rev_8_21_14_0_10_42_17 TaxID=1974584 RepID=A0A2M6WI13_9BACT|nr:MAG: epimerase [Candidatus Harrisonbacteria bacterium CG10_big_fil_rev_8_21_14_0_10_42_17]
MAKVFISGIAGFLGSHLADRLLASGHEVFGCDNMLGGYSDNVPNGAQFHNVDTQNFEAMKELLRGMEVVYHCAAAPHEGLSVFSPKLINDHTYNSTVAILTAAIVDNVKRFVFTSSMARYGTQKTMPFTEEQIPCPQDPYGIAKYASELQIKTLCNAHGVEYAIAIPHNIIGTRQKYDDPFRNVVAIMINMMLQGRQPIIYGDGEQQRCFSFVEDVVHPMEKLGFQDNVAGHLFNVGPDEETITINELARRIAKQLNFHLNPVYLPDRPLEVRIATCSADKARNMLGYKTTRSLNEGIADMIAWIEKRGVKKFEYHLPLEIISEKTPKSWKEKMF